MIWNLLIHLGAGLFGYNIFRLDTVGLVACIVLTVIVQSISTFRFQQWAKQKYENSLQSGSKSWKELSGSGAYKAKMVQLFLVKVVFYSAITLASAYVARVVMA